MALWLKNLPLFIGLMGLASLSMLVPALHAFFAYDDEATARVFLYAALMCGVLTIVVGLAAQSYEQSTAGRSQLLFLFASMSILPLILALPFYEAVGTISYFEAWFEMVSSFTTTGATLFNTPSDLNPSLHLWRALVGWMGGLFVWVTAVAILAPMNIGGFEVRARSRSGLGDRRHTRIGAQAAPTERIMRFALTLTPIYGGLTLMLMVGLLIAGEIPIVAICHAMSVMATSGISPIGGMQFGASAVMGEVIVFVFLLFALSRLTFSRGMFSDDADAVWHDSELRLGVAIVLLVAFVLFFRHFLTQDDALVIGRLGGDALSAFWGGAFTALSFLTTTGFESSLFEGARIWSDLGSAGVILLGLALIGGGVATTAGGVKLLRVYALIRHGERELNRLVHPHSVGGGGEEARRIRRQGAYISWIYFMLLALSLAAVMLALSFAGLPFENAMVFSVAALTTTGPLTEIKTGMDVALADLSVFGQSVFALAMVLGRLETLALISLLNPEFWRR